MLQLCLKLFSFFLVSLFCSSSSSISDFPSSIVPVVYVIFGEIPHYLQFNIELASRNNPVVVIMEGSFPTKNNNNNSSNNNDASITPKKRIVIYEKMSDYFDSATLFAPNYIHLSRDHSDKRKRHELRCIQRWYVLNDFMAKNKIAKAFFGDGDSSVFVNVTEAFLLRPQCQAVINVEAQGNNLHWVGAGEASLWTMEGITSLCKFTSEVYGKHKPLLQIKGNGGSSVVDMSLLWLWWVANHKDAGWTSGRPWNHWDAMASTAVVESYRARTDEAFMFAKKLSLPQMGQTLTLCNGMDVVNRTVFDHMVGKSFNSDHFFIKNSNRFVLVRIYIND